MLLFQNITIMEEYLYVSDDQINHINLCTVGTGMDAWGINLVELERVSIGNDRWRNNGVLYLNALPKWGVSIDKFYWQFWRTNIKLRRQSILVNIWQTIYKNTSTEGFIPNLRMSIFHDMW